MKRRHNAQGRGSTPPAGFLFSFCLRGGTTFFPGRRGEFRAPARVTFGNSLFCLRRPLFFQQRKKRGKETPPKTTFWISLRAFTWFLSCQNKPREHCAAEISPKYCIVSASWSAAAFALKCRSERFYASVCRGGVLPRPKHCEKSAGGAEPLPYGRFYEGADENRLSLRQNRRF
mgnify:CR=1 FL=1